MKDDIAAESPTGEDCEGHTGGDPGHAFQAPDSQGHKARQNDTGKAKDSPPPENGVLLQSEPSKVARKIGKLKRAAWGAIEARERLPQPLFWSLFHAEVAEIRKLKARERAIRGVLLGVDVTE